MGTTGRLFYEGKKLVIDPFTPFSLFFEVESLENGGIFLRGVFQVGSHRGFVDECTCFVPARPTWMIAHGILREIEDAMPLKWVRLLLQKEVVLEKSLALEFLKEFEGEACLIWKKQAPSLVIDPIPLLQLSDRHGAFADLLFDYGPLGKVAAHESCVQAFRNKESEGGVGAGSSGDRFSEKDRRSLPLLLPSGQSGKEFEFFARDRVDDFRCGREGGSTGKRQKI